VLCAIHAKLPIHCRRLCAGTALPLIERGEHVARLAVTSLAPNACCRRRGSPERDARCPGAVHMRGANSCALGSSIGCSWYSLGVATPSKAKLGPPQAQGGQASNRGLVLLVVLENPVKPTTRPTSNRTPKPCQPGPWPATDPLTPPSTSCPSLSYVSRPNIPQFNTQNIELGTFIAQRFVAKRRARLAHALAQVRIQPQAIVSVSTANTQIISLAENAKIVLAAERKRLEADLFRCGSS